MQDAQSETASTSQHVGGTTAQWDPEQYEMFKDERAEPFRDLAKLVEKRPGLRVVDLGCGTGEMTAWLHRELGAAETVGLDSSEEMLVAAHSRAGGGLRFTLGDIVTFAASGNGVPYDLIFSNAALQWVDGHDSLIEQLTALLAPKGQIAVQMPMPGAVHPAGHVLGDLVRQSPYAEALGTVRRASGTRAPDFYATHLHELGYEQFHVRLQVYGHLLPEALSMVEWFKGSALAPYRAQLPHDLYQQLVRDYEAEVVRLCGRGKPYFLPFNRILVWGRLP